MKKTLIAFSFLIGLGFLQTACTDNFDDINTDPTKAPASTFDPNLLLSSIQYNHVNANAGYNGAILFQSMWVQILASTSSGSANYYSNADKYVISGSTVDYQQRTWNIAYKAAGYAYEMEQLTKNKPELSNLTNIAVIMQIQALASITDTYGDIPYTQALQAKSGISQPIYDTQETTYKSFLSRLETAVAALSTSASTPTNDLFYKGDISKWKKYGYSLMLKLAMRLVKADPTTAKTYAEKAVAGGVFTSVADDAYVVTDNTNGYNNSNGQALNVPDDIYQVRWSKVLIDYLITNDDPRLAKIAEIPGNGLAANSSVAAGNSDPEIQIGLPNGYDLNGGLTDIRTHTDYPGNTPAAGTNDSPALLGKYSRPTPIYRNFSGPLFVLSYAEVALLQAEASVRGYSVGGTAADFYKKGVSAGIQSLGKLGTAAVIDAATADAYAAAHPLDSESALQQINEQYWATNGLFMNFVEAWNNWKRSGYPTLTAVNYTGNFSNGKIPRRQPYPTGENALNPTNYQAAASRLTGGDTWGASIWWDKQ